MRFPVCLCVTLAFLIQSGSGNAFEAIRMSKDEESRSLDWLIPLPKQIRVASKIDLLPSQIRVTTREGAAPPELQAATEIRERLGQGDEIQVEEPVFEILLGTCDDRGWIGQVRLPVAEEMRSLPNADQSYAIRPVPGDRLVLVGLTPAGVYYAGRTLCQLLDAHPAGQGLQLPLPEVLDWPDLAERGEWGGSAVKDIPWMAGFKLNLVEAHVSLKVTSEGAAVAEADPDLIHLGESYGLKVVPIITHLDQLSRTGIYEVIPDLRGKGNGAQHPTYAHVCAPCASHPQFIRILTEWMCGLASQQTSPHITAWLSEHHLQCECASCQATGQYVLETRSLVEAWRQALATHPNLKLRILLTQGSYATNERVLAECPPEVGVIYYDGGRTYNSSRDPMIYPLLESFADEGRWLGCYPQLTASWRIVCPWSGPQFIQYRMREFVDKHLQCLCGYATPNNRLYAFNVIAAAEWSWNGRGRSPQAFARAWATRRGMKDPSKAARWAVTLGPVGWDVYGSGVPYPHLFGHAGHAVQTGARLDLGDGLFRYFPSEKHMARDLSACRKALKTAEDLEDPLLTMESLVLEGYVGLLREIWNISQIMAESPEHRLRSRPTLQRSMNALAQAGFQTCASLTRWEEAIEPGLGGARFGDTVNVTEKTVTDIGQALAPLGVRNPWAQYAKQAVGDWVSEDFEAQESITKTWDVTDKIHGDGLYEVEFIYTEGWWGLNMERVTLLADMGASGRQILSEDAHPGVAAHQNKDPRYGLSLRDEAPDATYLLEVQIKGVRSSDKPEDRKGCCGQVYLRKILPEGLGLPAAELDPLSEDRDTLLGPRPSFAPGKLAVGVLDGGYGATTITACLTQCNDMDTQALKSIELTHLDACQVLVIPQPRDPNRLSPKDVATLRKRIKRGLGLVVTHDAVGYRGHPAIVESICPGGAIHVKETRWTVVREHPVTEGLALNAYFEHTYDDHVTLLSEGSHVVLATGVANERPVLLCGELGQGRYVACGLALGLGPGNVDVDPSAEEATMLANAVRWCVKSP